MAAPLPNFFTNYWDFSDKGIFGEMLIYTVCLFLATFFLPYLLQAFFSKNNRIFKNGLSLFVVQLPSLIIAGALSLFFNHSFLILVAFPVFFSIFLFIFSRLFSKNESIKITSSKIAAGYLIIVAALLFIIVFSSHVSRWISYKNEYQKLLQRQQPPAQQTSELVTPVIMSPQNGEIRTDYPIAIKGKGKPFSEVNIYTGYTPNELQCLTKNTYASGGSTVADQNGEFSDTIAGGYGRKGVRTLRVVSLPKDFVIGSNECFPKAIMSDIVNFDYQGKVISQ